MTFKNLITLAVALLLAALATACGPLLGAGGERPPAIPVLPTATPGSSGTVRELATVERIEILTLESFPVQVQVRAFGSLPDSCTTIQESTQLRDGQVFSVSIFTERPGEAACAQVLQPFEETIPLDVAGLKAGNYSVHVNGVFGGFTLAADNEVTASLAGRVWHDLCALGGGEGDAPLVPSAGCVPFEGTYRANGRLESGEPGLAGLLVRLGLGACPSGGLAEATTDSDGAYHFSGLAPGMYCVSIDSLAAANSPVLIPGEWTHPPVEAGSPTAGAAIVLSAGENKTGVDFGWDYQFLPVPPQVPTPTPAPTATPVSRCDWAQFVADVTVPDHAPYSPGAAFTKTWRLKNIGTCTWTADYDMVFVDGNAMTDRVVQALPGTVRPGETVDLSVPMTAPTLVGNYKGSWMLRNGEGRLFGLGTSADKAFWALIKVIAPNNRFVYDFAANYCLATWKSDAGALACPGSSSATRGFVVLLDNPQLENRRENERTLWLRPNHEAGGWISGEYPPIMVQQGDRFRAWVGCLAASPGCDVTFTLKYRAADGNGQETRITWDEVFDGQVSVVDIDLSALARKKVIFSLSAAINNRRFEDANAFWFAPRIENAGFNPEESGESAAAIQAARKMVAAALGIGNKDLNFIRVEGPVNWATTCLDVQIDDGSCKPAVISGYRVIFEYAGGKYEAHTNLSGSIVYWFYAGVWK